MHVDPVEQVSSGAALLHSLAGTFDDAERLIANGCKRTLPMTQSEVTEHAPRVGNPLDVESVSAPLGADSRAFRRSGTAEFCPEPLLRGTLLAGMRIGRADSRRSRLPRGWMQALVGLLAACQSASSLPASRVPPAANAAPSHAEPAPASASAAPPAPTPRSPASEPESPTPQAEASGARPASPTSEPPAPAPSAAPASGPPGLHVDFSNAEGLSKKFDDPQRDAWQRPDQVIERMHIVPGSSVVDLGTGTGYFIERLSRAVGPKGSVLALDVEPNMVSFVQQRAAHLGLGNVQARVVATDDPGLAPASVARVLIVDTWHHIDDRGRYAQKLARALQPGGEVWVVDFTLESKRGPPVQHRLAPERVLQELEAGGLHAQVVRGETLPDQYIVRGVR